MTEIILPSVDWKIFFLISCLQTNFVKVCIYLFVLLNYFVLLSDRSGLFSEMFMHVLQLRHH